MSKTSPPVPDGLSPRSATVWNELTCPASWAAHELVAFQRALEWFDRSDALIASAAAATGREAAGFLKLSMDASNTGLRYWRTLKFIDADQAARRPGRPSDDGWSAKRKLQKVG